MTFEFYKNNIHIATEDIYTNYLYLEFWKENKYLSILIGDVTQIESTVHEDEFGFKTMGTFSVLTESGDYIQTSRGFVATHHRDLVIFETYRTPVIPDKVPDQYSEYKWIGTTASKELHNYPETFYLEKDCEYIETYSSRIRAEHELILAFWEKHKMELETL